MGRGSVGWKSEEESVQCVESEGDIDAKTADRQTHTQTQAKVTQPPPPPGTQTNWR